MNFLTTYSRSQIIMPLFHRIVPKKYYPDTTKEVEIINNQTKTFSNNYIFLVRLVKSIGRLLKPIKPDENLGKTNNSYGVPRLLR